MKKILSILLIVSFSEVYSQEEFFVNQNGISVWHMRGDAKNLEQFNGTGLSFCFKQNLVLGVGYQQTDLITLPVISVGYFSQTQPVNHPLRFAFNISYSHSKGTNYGGINFGLIKCFFIENEFPFSLNAHVSIETAFNGGKSYTFPGFGFGYVQTISSKGMLYPYIGISYDRIFDVYKGADAFTGIIGLNIRLGAKSDNSSVNENSVL